MSSTPSYRTLNTRREKIKRLKNEILKGVRMDQAVINAGIKNNSFIAYHSNQMYKDRLRRFFDACVARGQVKRNGMVEDAHFKKMCEGKASASDYEFYLCNRMPERWKKLKDNTLVVQNTINNEAAQSGSNGTFNGEDAQLTEYVRAKLFPNLPAK